MKYITNKYNNFIKEIIPGGFRQLCYELVIIAIFVYTAKALLAMSSGSNIINLY